MLTNLFRTEVVNISNSLRASYSLQTSGLPKKLVSSINSEGELRELNDVFPEVVETFGESVKYKNGPPLSKWLVRLLEQNLTNGSKSKALIIPAAYKTLEDPKELTPEKIKLANVMAWCLELLQGYMMVHDDILDSAERRRNGVPWYRQEGVGLSAMNDGVLLENAAFVILKRYFSNHPSYTAFLDLSHMVVLSHAMGQTWEMLAAAETKVNPNILNTENYRIFSYIKSEQFCFYYPVMLAMHLANKFDSELHEQLKPLLLEIGHVVMVENDIRDVFDNITLNGNIGPDTQEGRFSFLIITALQEATESQKMILEANYGKRDPEAVSIVINLYEELNLRRICENYVEERLNYIRNGFRRIGRGHPYKLFFEFLDRAVEIQSWKEKEYWCT